MKKLYATIVFVLAVLVASAQTLNPNRMLVTTTTGNVTGYAIDKVDSISFANVEGEVAANVNFLNYATGDTGDTIWVEVTRTADCESFSIDVLPTNTANRYNTDDIIASYFSMMGSSKYYQDFTSGQLSGFTTAFKANTSYTVITMGYDRYGVACKASRAEFTTPKKPLVGSPNVTWTLDEATASTLTFTFTPNADTQGFAYCLFKKGEAQSQYEQWGPMMGFSNMGDMIKQFSFYTFNTVKTNKWDGLSPNTEYEIYVQPWDVNGTYSDMVIATATTSKLGGEGVATVSVEIKEFGGDATNGYYQHITFTPNDQTALYRDIIITKEAYDSEWGDDKVKEYFMNDTNPYNPYDSYWDHYTVDDNYWSLSPATSYYAIARAKNANDEWGDLVKLEFTTPEAATKAPRKVSQIGVRKEAPVGQRTAIVPASKWSGAKLTSVK